VSSEAKGVTRRLTDPRWRVKSHSRLYAEVLCRQPGLVATSLYARQCLVAEPGRNPHPCLQALLPETGVLEESRGVQDPCVGFLARIQPSLCPSHGVDLDESEDASVVRQTCPEFIAGFVSNDTSCRSCGFNGFLAGPRPIFHGVDTYPRRNGEDGLRRGVQPRWAAARFRFFR